jgi:hypothetical protein
LGELALSFNAFFLGYDGPMLALVRGETSSVTNPKIYFAYVKSDPTGGGRMATPYSLEYEVLYPDGTVKVARTAVNLTTEAVNCGYAPTIAFLVGDPLGNYTVNWFAELTNTADEETWKTVFPLLAVGSLIPDGYASIAQMRDEGVPVAFNDARLKMAIEIASRRIENITRRFFEPRFKTIDVDGVGGPMILLEDPIIGICDIDYVFDSVSPSEIPVALENLRIYNRHMRGLINPDDRANPKIEFINCYALYGMDSYTGEEFTRYREGAYQTRFAVGQQNVRMTGWFGYTDPDGSPLGKTPDLISYVCILMAMQSVRPAWKNFGSSSGSGSHGNLIQERTRDQTVWYETGVDASFKAGITGDPTIDQILSRFMAPMRLGAA